MPAGAISPWSCAAPYPKPDAAPCRAGDEITLGPDGEHPAHWFDAETGKRIQRSLSRAGRPQGRAGAQMPIKKRRGPGRVAAAVFVGAGVRQDAPATERLT